MLGDIILVILCSLFSVIVVIGLFGGFDDDGDNPFKN